MLISVLSASVTRPGFGRIELQVARDGSADFIIRNRENRALAAAGLRIAAELEQLAGSDGWDLEVDASGARQGIVEIDCRHERMGADAITELLGDACSHCGFARDLDPACGGQGEPL